MNVVHYLVKKDDFEEGWGRIPVWGFADVVASKCDEVPVGERVYGFFPISSHLVMKPSAIKSERFMDLAESRQSLPPLYNVYERLSSETCEYKQEWRELSVHRAAGLVGQLNIETAGLGMLE